MKRADSHLGPLLPLFLLRFNIPDAAIERQNTLSPSGLGLHLPFSMDKIYIYLYIHDAIGLIFLEITLPQRAYPHS